MSKHNHMKRIMCRIIAIMLIMAVSLSNIAFAITDTIIKDKISSPLSFQMEEFGNSYTVAAICRSIEKFVSLDNEKAIGNICSWANKAPNSEMVITSGINEIIIDIPREGMAIRYFVPGKIQTVTPYNDVFRMRTIVITPQLCRQVMYRTTAIQGNSFVGRNLLDMEEDEIISIIDPRQNELKKHSRADWKYAQLLAGIFDIQKGSLEWKMLRSICLAHDIGGILGNKRDEDIEKALLVLEIYVVTLVLMLSF